MGKSYDRSYYEERQRRTAYAARVILGIVLERCGPVRSAIDVGCGVGTWLQVLSGKGVADIQGVDGPWVEADLLEIPADRFLRVNLAEGEPVNVSRRFDLAISLEVAEHLPPERAEGFVSLLTGLSDRVLFSAAVPRQGGARHLNEQWQSYWARLFDARGYEPHDFVRARIWHDEQMPYWYRQNVLFFARRGLTLPESPAISDPACMPLDVVHPFLFLKRVPRKRRLKDRLRNIFGVMRRD